MSSNVIRCHGKEMWNGGKKGKSEEKKGKKGKCKDGTAQP